MLFQGRDLNSYRETGHIEAFHFEMTVFYGPDRQIHPAENITSKIIGTIDTVV